LVSLNIKDPETHRLAAELARLTGESPTRAVTEALRERLERVRERLGREETRRHQPHALSAELLAIGRRCAAHMRQPAHSSDHGDLLYDELGLPK
jgi:antitoxin VapB